MFRRFLSTLIPVFQCRNFLFIYSVIHLQGFHFLKFLSLKYLKKPRTQTPLVTRIQTESVYFLIANTLHIRLGAAPFGRC